MQSIYSFREGSALKSTSTRTRRTAGYRSKARVKAEAEAKVGAEVGAEAGAEAGAKAEARPEAEPKPKRDQKNELNHELKRDQKDDEPKVDEAKRAGTGREQRVATKQKSKACFANTACCVIFWRRAAQQTLLKKF